MNLYTVTRPMRRLALNIIKDRLGCGSNKAKTKAIIWGSRKGYPKTTHGRMVAVCDYALSLEVNHG